MSQQVLSDLDFVNASRLLNLPPPVGASEPVRKSDLDAAIEGLAWKDDVRVSTQGNINLSSPGGTIDGVTLATNDRILVRLQTDNTQNGIYVWTGAATPLTRSLDANTGAELREAVVTVSQGTDSGNVYRQSTSTLVLGTNPVTFVPFGSSAPNASTVTPGLIEIATQAEVDAGTDTIRAVTPATLSNWSGRFRKVSATIGDGSATQFDVTHNFNTRDVWVSVRRSIAPFDQVIVDNEATTVNVVRVIFASAPAPNAFVVTVGA